MRRPAGSARAMAAACGFSVADAADAMILDREDGGRFSRLEVHADDVRLGGNLEVLGSLGLASWRLRAGGSEADPTLDLQPLADRGALNVRNASGTQEVMLGVDQDGGVVSTMTGHDLQLRAGGNQAVMTLKADRPGRDRHGRARRTARGGRPDQSGLPDLGRLAVQPETTPLLATMLLDQDDSQNYALAQGSSGGDLGRTFLNSPLGIDFRIGNVTRMALANDGKFGIGTSSPQAPLHIATGTDVTPREAGYLVIGQHLRRFIGIRRQRDPRARSGRGLDPAPPVRWRRRLDPFEGRRRHGHDQGRRSPRHRRRGPRAPDPRRRRRALFRGREWRNASSISCKRDVESLSLDDALAALRDLRPVTFKYIDDDEVRAGFIAEEVPDLVATSDRTSLSADGLRGGADPGRAVPARANSGAVGALSMGQGQPLQRPRA